MNFRRLKDKNRKENNYQARKSQCNGSRRQPLLSILSAQFLITSAIQSILAQCRATPKINDLPVNSLIEILFGKIQVWISAEILAHEMDTSEVNALNYFQSPVSDRLIHCINCNGRSVIGGKHSLLLIK